MQSMLRAKAWSSALYSKNAIVTYPKVKQTEKAIPIRARDFDLVSVSVTSPIIAVLSCTLPSLSPPINRESKKDA